MANVLSGLISQLLMLSIYAVFTRLIGFSGVFAFNSSKLLEFCGRNIYLSSMYFGEIIFVLFGLGYTSKIRASNAFAV